MISCDSKEQDLFAQVKAQRQVLGIQCSAGVEFMKHRPAGSKLASLHPSLCQYKVMKHFFPHKTRITAEGKTAQKRDELISPSDLLTFTLVWVCLRRKRQ